MCPVCAQLLLAIARAIRTFIFGVSLVLLSSELVRGAFMSKRCADAVNGRHSKWDLTAAYRRKTISNSCTARL